MKNISDMSILITGGGSGIGEGTASYFVKNGAKDFGKQNIQTAIIVHIGHIIAESSQITKEYQGVVSLQLGY